MNSGLSLVWDPLWAVPVLEVPERLLLVQG